MSTALISTGAWRGVRACVVSSPLYVVPTTQPNVAGFQRLPTDPVGSAVLTLTGLQPGSDIVVLLAGTETELLNVDAHAGVSYGWSSDRFVAPTTVDIGVFKTGFVPFYIRGYTLASTDATLPIAQVADRNYRNPT